MLPVLIGAVIGAVAYSCLSDDKETETYSNGDYKEPDFLKDETDRTEIEELAENLKELVLNKRRSLFEKREEALERHDMEMARRIDEKLKLTEEDLLKIAQIVDSVAEERRELLKKLLKEFSVLVDDVTKKCWEEKKSSAKAKDKDPVDAPLREKDIVDAETEAVEKESKDLKGEGLKTRETIRNIRENMRKLLLETE
jgi:hypothetical protein